MEELNRILNILSERGLNNFSPEELDDLFAPLKEQYPEIYGDLTPAQIIELVIKQNPEISSTLPTRQQLEAWQAVAEQRSSSRQKSAAQAKQDIEAFKARQEVLLKRAKESRSRNESLNLKLKPEEIEKINKTFDKQTLAEINSQNETVFIVKHEEELTKVTNSQTRSRQILKEIHDTAINPTKSVIAAKAADKNSFLANAIASAEIREEVVSKLRKDLLSKRAQLESTLPQFTKFIILPEEVENIDLEIADEPVANAALVNIENLENIAYTSPDTITQTSFTAEINITPPSYIGIIPTKWVAEAAINDSLKKNEVEQKAVLTNLTGKLRVEIAAKASGVHFTKDDLKKLDSFFSKYPYSEQWIVGLQQYSSKFNNAQREVILKSSDSNFIPRVGGKFGFVQRIRSQVVGAGLKLFGKGANVALSEAKEKAITAGVKGASSLLAKAGLSKAAGAIASIAGTPIVGVIVSAAISSLQKAASWIKRKLKKLDKKEIFFYIALPLMLLGGIFPGAFGSIAQLGGVALGVGTIGSALPTIVKFLKSLSTNVLAPSLTKPIISTLIGVPIAVAIIIFFINTGAYLVPPGERAFGSGSVPSGISIEGSCPIPNGVISCGSLGSGSSVTGCEHGSNSYWAGLESIGTPKCSWGLPSSDGRRCSTSQIPGNVCYSSKSQCPDYGAALDVTYPGLNGAVCAADPQNYIAYFPRIDGQDLEWTFVTSLTGCSGECGIYRASSGSDAYEIYVTHLQSIVRSGSSGEPIGFIYCYLDTGPHLHIELKINGTYVQPDSLCQ